MCVIVLCSCFLRVLSVRFHITHHGIWGRSPLLLMSLVDGLCVLPEPIGWLCLQLDCPSIADLSRLPPLKSEPLYRNTSSQLTRCSPSGVTWKRFYYNNLSAYKTLVDLVVFLVTYIGHCETSMTD